MTGPAGLDAHVVVDLPVRRGAHEGDAGLSLLAPLRVPRGSVTAVLGPNGAGKSTVLRALAGLQPLSGGHVAVDGRTLDDPATGAFVPPHERGTGVVFADDLLFPHLCALDNAAFAPRSAGLSRSAARERAGRLLEALGIGDLASARPATLSGGQSQRVAIARALAARPALLLLDEPLAALDAGTRSAVRGVLQAAMTEAPEGGGAPPATVLVTHDPLDALVLADRLVVLERGVVVQSGPPAEVARAPRTEYVAGLVGLNLLGGSASASGSGRGGALRVDVDGGGSLVAAASPAADVAPGGAVLVSFAPSSVSLHAGPPSGSARNVWPGVVSGLERRGDVVRVSLHGAPDVLADVTAGAVAEMRLREGSALWASVKATEVRAYPV